MNEIESEFDGVVKEIIAQDAHPVEYGQVLFRIDPEWLIQFRRRAPPRRRPQAAARSTSRRSSSR